MVQAKIDSVDPPLGFGLIQAADLTDWETETSHAGLPSLLSAISEILGPSPLKVKEAEQLRVDEEKRRKEREERERKAAEEKRLKSQELKRKTEEERQKKEADAKRKAEEEQKLSEVMAAIKPEMPEPKAMSLKIDGLS